MSHLAVSVLGADRPGMVAAVTEVLTAQGCNLEDSSMTILGGHFAMMLVVEAGDLGAEVLEARLGPVAASMQLVVSARPIADLPKESRGDQALWTVAVYGADRPGIVSEVAGLLASYQANIVDLSTRVIGTAHEPVYAMVMEIAIDDVGALEPALNQLAEALGVSCSLYPADADIL